MTNNGTDQVANFSNAVYDSGRDASAERKRVGISATEIELLDDIPPASDREATDSRRMFEIVPSSNDKQKQQNNYHTLSLNRDPNKPSIVYQDENNPQVNSAFDKLIEKYAPDAVPSNLLNGSNNHRSPPQASASAAAAASSSSSSSAHAREQPGSSTFQTTSPPSSTASHNYSTVIRPSNKQTSQNQTQPNNTSSNSANNVPTSSYRQPASAYDNFQRAVPPSQNAQSQQAPLQSTIPVQVQNGNFAQVVPGKLYTLDEDPLHLLYDRQNPVLPPKQQTTFNSTFQPSTNFPAAGTKLPTVIYTNTTQRTPLQSVPISTNVDPTTNPSLSGLPPFDLGNLIKRVQQDYLREIQPFVSSVKFVEKDREFGQSLGDIGFSTPVSVRKGFRTQADDILRRSFGRKDHPQPPRNYDDEENTYSESDSELYDDDITDLRPSVRRDKLQNKISKESITSVTSVTSATDSEYGERYSTHASKKKKAVRSQGTSPPAGRNLAKAEAPNYASTSAAKASPKPVDSDEEAPKKAPPAQSGTKLAKRVSSDRRSSDPSDSDESDERNGSSSEYKKHGSTTGSRASAAEKVGPLITSTPIAKPGDEAARERSKATQRSEDIHPTPPTIRPGQANTQLQPKKSNSDESVTATTGSESADSEDDDHSAIYNGQQPASTASQPNNARTSAGIPGGRGAQPAAPNARDSIGQNSTATAPANIRETARQNPTAGATTNARDAAGQNPYVAAPSNAREVARLTPTTATPTNARELAGQNPTTTARTTVENTGKQTGPNIHFVPPDQRAAVNQRTTPTSTATQPAATAAAAAAATGPTQTGSNRLFQTENDSKSGAKRSLKEVPATIGDKFKSLFRRK